MALEVTDVDAEADGDGEVPLVFGSLPELQPESDRAAAATTASGATHWRRVVKRFCDVMGSYSPDSF
jgi:hypothetical protein